MMTAADRRIAALDVARQVADAVLYEGYVLFPYRASAAKNRYRWQWGVVVPAADGDRVGEPDELGCDVLVRGPGRVVAAARFLRLRHRQVRDADGHAVDQLVVDGEPVVTWDEGDEVELAAGPIPIEDLVGTPRIVEFAYPAVTAREPLAVGGAVERTTRAIDVCLTVAADRLADDVVRLRLRVANRTGGASPAGADRSEVLRRSMVGVHLLVEACDGAELASCIDPPDWAAPWADALDRTRLHPVVVGPQDRPATVVLAAPIILPDHPEVAAESPGPSFDATEVDELLALAVMGLTDEEKREARATDHRAAELVDRTDALPPDVLQRLHGRLSDPTLADGSSPDGTPVDDRVDEDIAAFLGIGEAPTERLRLGDVELALGSQVRLHPRRRADAHDLFVDGRVATVERIVTTVEGDTMLGVTLVDDPAADLHRWYGRFQYFDVTEVAPLEGGGGALPDSLGQGGSHG